MNKTLFATLLATLLAFFILLGTAANADGPRPPEQRRVLHPLDYRGVTLEDGFLKRQVDEVKAFYLAIPDDDLLHGFRQRAGRPAPGKELGGWYSDDLFHIFGQVISGLSRLHAATGDVACRDKVNHLIAEWAKCIEPDGFFYYSRTPKSPHYTYDKMVGGLVDAHLYARNPHALQHLYRITEWARKHLDRDRKCPSEANGNADEWYTLSENLYRASLADGKRGPAYRDFGKLWEYTDYWNFYAHRANIFDAKCEGKPRAYHAYSHVNTLGGAAAAYLVTGQSHYLESIRTAYDFLQTTECFATGGYGPNEHFFPPAALEATLSHTHATFETQCGSWAGFKLGKSLISLTGDARYGDWIERLVYNGVGASLPNAKNGRAFYYSDYNPAGGSKRLHEVPWTCCAGTRPNAVADYCDLIYFKGKDGICVNLYTPSAVHFRANGQPVVLRQETTFPETDKVTFVVHLKQPIEFELKLRKPQWLAAPVAATINGRPTELSEDKLHWLVIQRPWRPGDHLQIRLPMSPTARRFAAGHSRHYAVSVGPVVLAAKAQGNPSALLDATRLEESLQPSDDSPLTYRVKGAPHAVLKPFYQFHAGEKYYMYFAGQQPTRPARPPKGQKPPTE